MSHVFSAVLINTRYIFREYIIINKMNKCAFHTHTLTLNIHSPCTASIEVCQSHECVAPRRDIQTPSNASAYYIHIYIYILFTHKTRAISSHTASTTCARRIREHSKRHCVKTTKLKIQSILSVWRQAKMTVILFPQRIKQKNTALKCTIIIKYVFCICFAH